MRMKSPAREGVVSIAFPVWNEEDNLEELHKRVTEALVDTGVGYELMFVDNGSTDGSLAVIKRLRDRDTCVRYVSLSRNFGHQAGLFAGMSHATGDAVITMDSDLQHPPSLIPEMVRLWREGSDVVYTTKRGHHYSGLKGLQVKLFYWLISRVSGLNLSFGQSDFRLLDRQVVNTLLRMPEYRKFLRGAVDWVGYQQAALEYDVADRYRGKSKFSYKSLVSFAVDGVLAFSTMPLRWMLATGLIIASASVAYAIVAATLGILSLAGAGLALPPGWATIAASISFFGGVQLIAIGVVGEYIGRIYEQTKGRPVFIVRDGSEKRGEGTASKEQAP